MCVEDLYDVPSIEARFWLGVNKTETCWLWRKARNNQGYGIFHARLRKDRHVHALRAHRVAYLLTYGVIPDGCLVLHNCPGGDNPSCVNPAHLDCGTYHENMVDMVRKNRKRGGGKPGSAHHQALLTESMVRAIRTQYAAGGITRRELADRYGVSMWTIRDVLTTACLEA